MYTYVHIYIYICQSHEPCYSIICWRIPSRCWPYFEPRLRPWRILVPPRCPTSVLLATCVCHAMKGKGLPWLRQGAETNGHSWDFFGWMNPPPKIWCQSFWVILKSKDLCCFVIIYDIRDNMALCRSNDDTHTIDQHWICSLWLWHHPYWSLCHFDHISVYPYTILYMHYSVGLIAGLLNHGLEIFRHGWWMVSQSCTCQES